MTRFVRLICLLVIKIFYREIGTRYLDADKKPKLDRPTLVVANHPNGLMDPIVLRIALGHDVGFLAKSTLFENWFGRTSMNAFDAIPVYRAKDGKDTSLNEEMFQAVYDAVESGGWIALFPEGVSHDDPKLRPLKTGAARMYFGGKLRAENLQIVPLGIDYESKEHFRSRVSVTVGETITSELTGEGENDVRDLTDQIARSLSEITLEAGSSEIRNGLVWVARWLEGEDASVESVGEKAQQLSEAFEHLMATDQAEADALVEDVRAFVRSLDNVGLNAWEIDEKLQIRAFVPYLFGAFPALVGALLSYPTYYAIRPLAEAVAKGERDLVSTIKAIAGLLFFPLTWIAEAFLFWWIYPPVGLAVLVLAAPLSLFSIQYFEHLSWRRSAIRAFGFRRRDPELARFILDERERIGQRIETALLEKRLDYSA